ncbi:hypothetical protein R8562_03440 [Klebsiella pneumoniae]|nr:hypothetical protein [Klebsiella pneumoniae]WPH79993.1 hypothetical protein R8537_19965 [Klebsiella pneumoniae]WPH90426.1 hypothetical protein R8546_03440 [Klebsiella pneumoniae]WPI06776.1 hypothetical protein R8562_03440 [Klebsiella pneumoniae]
MTLQAVNELIASLESAGEPSIREQKFLKLAKAFKQLAAENVGLKAAIRAVNRTAEECELNGDELKYVVEPSEFEALTDLLDETPATSAYLAGIKADGVEEFAAHLVSMECHLEAEWAKSFVLEVLNVKGR